MDTTEDRILDGHVVLRQPAEGYRAAVDPVFLAAAVEARAGQRALDLGCGAGAALLCLAWRVAGLQVDGVELQPHLAGLARTNITANGLQDRARAFAGDILSPPGDLAPGHYDHVFANPPYLSAARGNPPPGRSKRTAHVEGDADLAAWVGAALRFAKRKGTVTFIQRADRLGELLAALSGEKAGDICVFPLWPKAGQAAKRVVVSARKEVKTPLTMAPGLVLHEADGRYTAAADRVLKGGALCIRV